MQLALVHIDSCQNTVRRKQPVLLTKCRQGKWCVTNLDEFVPETFSALTVKGQPQERRFSSSARVSPDPFTHYKIRFPSRALKFHTMGEDGSRGLFFLFFFCLVRFVSISIGKIVIAYWKQMCLSQWMRCFYDYFHVMLHTSNAIHTDTHVKPVCEDELEQ